MLRMHVLRAAALGGALLLSACGGGREDVAAAPPDDAPPNTMNICAIFADKPHWRTHMEQASARWGTPVEVMMGIMWRESRFRQHASPGTSSAYGYAQAINGTWDWYRQDTGRHWARRDNFEDAADFVGWYTQLTSRKNGLSPTDSFAQYLAYHEGHSGFAKGSYWEKEFLLNAAQEVQTMTMVYQTQLAACPGAYT